MNDLGEVASIQMAPAAASPRAGIPHNAGQQGVIKATQRHERSLFSSSVTWNTQGAEFSRGKGGLSMARWKVNNGDIDLELPGEGHLFVDE